MSLFTVPFPEYDIANILQKAFPKKEKFSVAIPLSRQQEFYDLILLNGNNRKSLTIQVKSSRVYYNLPKYDFFESWHKSFNFEHKFSDFYFFYITFPLLNKHFAPGAKWDKKILVFSKEEMANLLPAKTHSFGFCISITNGTVSGGRGFNYNEKSLSNHLIENQIASLKKAIGVAL
jgi:hypothetical protein